MNKIKSYEEILKTWFNFISATKNIYNNKCGKLEYLREILIAGLEGS